MFSFNRDKKTQNSADEGNGNASADNLDEAFLDAAEVPPSNPTHEKSGGNANSSQEAAVPDINFTGYMDKFMSDVNKAGLGEDNNEYVEAYSSSAIQQSVAMMSEDARAYMQSMELIYVTATGKGLEMVANKQSQGKDLLSAVKTAQTNTAEFSLKMAACATAFSKL